MVYVYYCLWVGEVECESGIEVVVVVGIFDNGIIVVLVNDYVDCGFGGDGVESDLVVLDVDYV